MPQPNPLLIALIAGLGCAACNSPPPPVPPPAPGPTTQSPAPVSEGAEPASSDAEEGAAPAGEIEPPPLMPFGVAECDKFVEKYVACVDVRVPDDLKEKKMDELHEHRARWRELGKMEQGRVAMSLSCRGVSQRLKNDLIVEYGCEF